MSKIFVCYRREDSDYSADSIYEALKARFGDESVVFDVDTIPLGTDFREYITEQVNKCGVLLAVIGDRWVKLLSERLDEPNDFVRFEIEVALERGIPVVPVLVGRASVPSEKELPAALKNLAYRNATEVRGGRDLKDHLARLMTGLDDILKEQATERRGARKKPLPSRRPTLKTGKGAPSWEEDERLNPRIRIEGGRFLMGSPEGEGDDDERPQHHVTRSPFYTQEHEVTNEEYRRFDANHDFKKDHQRHPVVEVNWHEAMAYAQWLGGSLPTEAQWEFAARGERGRTYPWGEEEPRRGLANFSGRAEDLLPVGSHPKGRTPEGTDDLAGNVWEWCRDWYGDYPDEEQRDPTGPAKGRFRVLRGGSFFGNPKDLRSAVRLDAHPGSRYGALGFRVAWSVAGGLD